MSNIMLPSWAVDAVKDLPRPIQTGDLVYGISTRSWFPSCYANPPNVIVGRGRIPKPPDPTVKKNMTVALPAILLSEAELRRLWNQGGAVETEGEYYLRIARAQLRKVVTFFEANRWGPERWEQLRREAGIEEKEEKDGK